MKILTPIILTILLLVTLNPSHKRSVQIQADEGVTENEQNIEEATIPHMDAPSDAVVFALQDLMSIPEYERQFQYYVWIRDGDHGKAQRCNFMINNVVVEMSSANIVQPVVINDGFLLRYDTRSLGPRDTARMHRLLDRVIDPCFYLTKNEAITVRVPVTPYTASDGLIYDYKFEKRTITAFGNTVADVYEEALALQANCGRMVPIVSYEYLMTKTQSQINDGMYYDFIGVKDIKVKSGQSQVEAYVEKHAGITLNQAVKEYVDQRSVTVDSDITGKERMIVSFQGNRTKIGRNAGIWSFTLDTGEQAYDGDQSPLRNLGSTLHQLYRFAGGEGIGERMNGGNVYFLFDDNLNFVDEAPSNITKDHLIPKRHGTARLEPAISCYRCHAMREHEEDPEPMGWKAIKYDAQDMLNGRDIVINGQTINIGLDPVGDPKEIEILAGRYTAEFNKPLRRSREDLSDFIVLCTTTPDMNTTDTFRGIADDWSSYHYDRVDAATACRELGIRVPQHSDPLSTFRSSIFRRTTQMPTQDPFIVRLLLGGEIRRETWESIIQDVAKLVTPEDVLKNMSSLRKNHSFKEMPVNTSQVKEDEDE